MIRNILTRMFPGESAPASENKPSNQTAASATQSFGISSLPDSFETTASKGSAQFDLGLVPSSQDYDSATQKQGQLLEQKKKLSEEQQKVEELQKELQESKDKSPFDTLVAFFTGDDKGRTTDYQDQATLNNYNEAEKSSQHISETADDTSDDVKRYLG
jgi:hypothetical protein